MDVQLPTEPVQLLYFLGYVLGALLSTVFSLYIVRYRRDHPTALSFAVVTTLLGIWAFGYTARMLAPSLEAKLLWTQVAWIGISLTSVAVLVFVLYFVGRAHVLTRARLAVLLVIPVLTQIMLWTNERHGLFYEEVWLYTAGTLPVIASRGGTWFYGVHIPFSWGLYCLATILLIHFAFSTSHLYRTQAIALIIGALTPWIVNGMFLSGVRLHPELDPTPIGFTIGVSVIALAAFRVDFLGLVPVARSRVIDEVAECVFVLDDRGRLVDVNRAGVDLFDAISDSSWAIGDSAYEFFPPELDPSFIGEDDVTEIQLEVNGSPEWYMLRRYELGTPHPRGEIVSLTDITNQKRQERSLVRSQEQVATERDAKEAMRELLIGTAGERDIAQSICRALIEEQEFDVAWIVEIPNIDEDAPRTLAEFPSDCPLIDRLNRSREIRAAIIQRVLDAGGSVQVKAASSDASELSGAFKESGIQVCWAYPIEHGGISFGVLCVASTEPICPDPVLAEEFAEVLAFKIHVLRQQEALTADMMVELEFRISDGHFLATLAQELEIPEGDPIVAHEISVENEPQYLIELSNVSPDRIESVATDIDAIEGFDLVSEPDNPTVVQVETTTPTLGTLTRTHGGLLRSLTANHSHVSVTFQFSRRTDITQFATQLREHWPHSWMRSQQEIGIEPAFDDPQAGLTQKQKEALRAALIFGFFDRPQGATASDIAETLGLARSTFLHHLRSAERKVFEELHRTDER